MTMDVSYADLQNAAKELNSSCGLAIKYTGVKKLDLIADLKSNIATLDNVPESVAKFYSDNFAESPPLEVDGELTETPEPIAVLDSLDSETDSRLSDIIEYVAAYNKLINDENPKTMAGIVIEEFIINDDSPIDKIEVDFAGALDLLPNNYWQRLPEIVRTWDNEIMTPKLQPRVNKPAKEEKTKELKANKTEAEPKLKDNKSRKTAKALGDTWRYTPGTSSGMIMAVFKKMANGDKTKGFTVQQIFEECDKENIASNNLKGRVQTTLLYASRKDYGSQAEKVDGLWYARSIADD